LAHRVPSADQSNASRCRAAHILAVDDDLPFLALLRDVVHATDRVVTVGEATSGERAVEMADDLQPDMILMDVRMPGQGGIAAAKQIQTTHPWTIVVLISTTHPDELLPLIDNRVADAVISKSELEPQRLDEVWLRYRDGPAARPST
jgi:DNA-binding NarL/FixJ family response regulator